MVLVNKLKNYQMAKKIIQPSVDTKAAEELLNQAKQLRFEKFRDGYNALVKETGFEFTAVWGNAGEGRIGTQLQVKEVPPTPKEKK